MRRVRERFRFGLACRDFDHQFDHPDKAGALFPEMGVFAPPYPFFKNV